jgi:hypothetical protein
MLRPRIQEGRAGEPDRGDPRSHHGIVAVFTMRKGQNADGTPLYCAGCGFEANLILQSHR